ncbi:MAG: DUF4423 domain-containing protein [Proteobacteria bacterium]|nr:DUF4423 domain-containing protein [Pseudomonadota bacterium]
MDYRTILADSFQHRRRVNPRYSMRAFARDLAVSPSRLSEVIAGKGELSRDKGHTVAKKLGFSALQTEDFLDMIEASAAKHDGLRQEALDRIKARKRANPALRIETKQFESVAHWRTIAVWSFMFLPVFDGDVASISAHLKMSAFEVTAVLRSLRGLGLVALEGSKWRPAASDFSTGDTVSSEAIRSFHRDLSTMGRKSIDEQPMNCRHLDSLIMAFDSKRFGELQQLIADFVQTLSDEFTDKKTGDSVYAISLQMFRLVDPGALAKESAPARP